MNTLKLNNMLRILFIVFSTVFLLSACSETDGGTVLRNNYDPRAAGDEQRSCWQSEFLEIFYKNIGSQSEKVYKSIEKENPMHIVILGFTLWMAYQIFKHISSPSGESIGEFWNKVIKKAFLCALCGYLASSTKELYYVINTFIFPIYITILDFTAEVLNTTAKDPAARVDHIDLVSDFGGEEYLCEVYDHSINDVGCKIGNDVKFENGKFPDAPFKLMGCMACAVSDRLNIGYDLGMRLLGLVSVSSFIAAIFLIGSFTVAKIGFVFYLVDSIFRLNMVMIILPFLVMSYPFEVIRKWAKTGFKFIICSSAIMLCLGLIVSITVLAIQKMLLEGEYASFDNYRNFGTTALSIILMGFLIVKATGLSVELSTKITGIRASANFQKKFQQLAVTVGKAALTYCTGGAGKIATSIIDHVETLRNARTKYNNLKSKINSAKKRLNNLAGR